MTREELEQTHIGQDFLKMGKQYDVDMVLEYLFGLLKGQDGSGAYDREIKATKHVLEIITK